MTQKELTKLIANMNAQAMSFAHLSENPHGRDLRDRKTETYGERVVYILPVAFEVWAKQIQGWTKQLLDTVDDKETVLITKGETE